MLFRVAAGIGIVALTLSAQQTPQILGGISSTAPVEIDGTSMAPAPSWPIVDRDLIRTTSAPGLILTTDQNAITLMQTTTVRVRVIAPHQTWLFVREGGLSVTTKNDDVRICIANRLFQPSTAANGSLKLEKSGAITRTIDAGLLTELSVKNCGEELAAGMVLPVTGAVTGGTASAVAGGTAGAAAAAGGVSAAAAVGVAGAATAAGVSAGLATAIGAASSAGQCTSATGCNFNPTPITPSAP